MSNVNKHVTKTVRRLIKNTKFKLFTYKELEQAYPLSESDKGQMASQKSFSNVTKNYIAVDDEALKEATEIVLYELINLGTKKLGFKYLNTEEDIQTKEATIWMSTYKIIDAVDANPAMYEEMAYKYIRDLPKVNFEKADKDSERVTNYLANLMGVERVA